MQDQQRLAVLQAVDAGRQTAPEAAEALGLSVRQVRRLLARYRTNGVASVPHGNRGRAPKHALSPEFRERIATLVGESYTDANNHHAQELLAEEHGIQLSVSSLRRIRIDARCPSPRKRRPSKSHPRRERKPQAGMMLLLDASKHRWFGPDLPECHLLAAIDDATGEVFALFREQEDTFGYLELLRRVCQARGVPIVLYSDRRTLFGPTVDGKTDPLHAHFARVTAELGIHHSFAGSPQAKGRVERLFGTFQDRLVVLLRRRNVRSVEEANRCLPELLRQHNQRFAKEPASPESAYREPPVKTQLRRILALRFPRVVANDNTVSFGGKRILLQTKPQASLARKRVELAVEPDGTIAFWSGDQCVARGPDVQPPDSVTPSRIVRELPEPKTTPQPRLLKTRHEPVIVRPAPDHPWRRPLVAAPRPQPLQSAQSRGG